MTITNDNLPDVAEVVRWTIENRDAFSLISFQPLAQVGRTRRNLEGVTPQSLWDEVGKAMRSYGTELPGTAPMHFGHPECTRFVPFLAVQERGGKPRLVQFIRDHPEDVAIMEDFFRSGLAGAAFRDDLPLEVVARGAGMLMRQPRWLFGKARRWLDARLRETLGTTFFPLLARALARRVRVDGVTFTSHHFMSPAELATEVGRARLDACVFRVPYGDRMIPMCQANAGGDRDRFYDELSAARVH